MQGEYSKVLSLNVSTNSYLDTLDIISQKAKDRVASYACFANVHMTIEAYDNEEFQSQVNAADLVCADGMPLVKSVKLLYKKSIDRVAGMDMMPSVMQKAEEEGLSVFFYGSTDQILDKIKTETRIRFPKLKIAGTYSPPFRTLTQKELEAHHKMINDSGAHIVFVALGCPKQEKWMAENSKFIKAICLGVGGAFPVFAKLDKRAPKWIRDLSLEWLYRFFQEPKRLFKRYFYTNTKFLYLMLLRGNKSN